MTARDRSESMAARRWSRSVGAGAIVMCALIRVLAAHSTTPWWELDPLTGWRPESTLTPAVGLLLDAAAWVGAALILLAVRRSGEPVRWKSGLLVLLGVVGVALHGAILQPLIADSASAPRGDLEALSLGSAWAAAIVGAWALVHCASDRTLRRAAALTLLSVVAVLCAKGAYQALVEHPRIVATFDADPAAMLATKGWQPDSQSARLFERRLRQVEATGWFGLANVFGAVAGACAAAWLVVMIGAFRAAVRRLIAGGDAGLIAILVLAACAALALSGSKGAVVAALIGFGCVLATSLGARAALFLRRLTPWFGPLIVVAVLLLIILRGLVGERIGELSLLFRSQYITGAARIITDHPLLGVSPVGFKDAYLLAKPALSPEEVESPHSITFDFLARIGVFGAAWIALWLLWLRGAGVRLRQSFDQIRQGEDIDASKGASPWIVATIACATAASMAIERAVIGLDFALLHVLSAAVSAFAVIVTLRMCAADPEGHVHRWIDRALCAGALALAAHAMIDVAPVTPGSTAWFFAIFALAAGPRTALPSSELSSVSGRRLPWIVCTLILLAGAVCVGLRAAGVWRWEKQLQSAALALRPVGLLHDTIADTRVDPAVRAQSIRAQAAAAGLPPPQSPADYDALLRRLHALAIPHALGHLDLAAASEPTAWEPRLAAARLELTLAFDLAESGVWPEAERRAGAALRRVSSFFDITPRSANAAGRLASMHEALAQLWEGGPGGPARVSSHLHWAAEAWGVAAVLDPMGLGPAVARWRCLQQLGRAEEARVWGQRALDVNANLRLDPLKALTDEERRSIEASLRAPDASGPPAP